MKIDEFLDRYIQGEKGSWYFDIEIMWGKNISGGSFYTKPDAKRALLNKIQIFLDDPEEFLTGKKNGKRRI